MDGSQPLYGLWQMLSQSSQVPNVDNCVLSKEQTIRKQKPSQKAGFSREIISKNTNWKTLAQPWGHKGTQESLMDNSRLPL